MVLIISIISSRPGNTGDYQSSYLRVPNSFDRTSFWTVIIIIIKDLAIIYILGIADQILDTSIMSKQTFIVITHFLKK